MRKFNEAQAAEKLLEFLKSMPTEDLIEEVLRHARRSPEQWRRMSAADMARRLRLRFEMTQRQLARLAGLPHSKVAKIEGGQDIQLRTLRQLFAGLGCELLILPVSRLSAEALWRRTHDLCDEGYIRRRRRYPRR